MAERFTDNAERLFSEIVVDAFKKIYVYVDDPERYHFFRRFKAAFLSKGIHFVLLTLLPSVAFQARGNGINCKLLTWRTPRSDKNIPGEHCESLNSIERLCGSQTQEYATELCKILFQVFDNLLSNEDTGRVALWLWNGNATVSMALTAAARTNNVATLFLEIANIPGKVFIDPQGVSAKSQIYRHPAILDSIQVDQKEFGKWKARFVSSGNRPLQKNLSKKLYWNYFFDTPAFLLPFAIKDDQTPLLHRILKKLSRVKLEHNVDEHVLPEKFVFFPMQVQRDTQVQMFSDVDSLDALRIAKHEAEMAGLPLVAKPHPAETSLELLNILKRWVHSGEVLTTREPVNRLLNNAECVITVNSSVGFEAMVRGVRVKWLGKSLYSKLDTEQRMSAFVMHYLMDIDYFSEADISEETVSVLLRRTRAFQGNNDLQ